MISDNIKKITDSSTFVINKKVCDLKKQGVDVVNFGLGESNFKIPQTIIDNALKSVSNEEGYYSPVKGIKKLRQAFADYLQKYNLNYDKDDLIIDSGSKHLIYCVMLVLANPGDEILLQTPYWVSYIDQVILAGLNVKLLETDESTDFKITSEQLENAITDKTRLLILNTPNNPSGVIYDKEELEKIAEVLVKKKVHVVSDEIYCEYAFDKPHVSIGSLNPEIKKLTITTGGVSKSHAIGGWRIGFAASNDKDIIKALAKVVSNTTSCAPIICQKACVETFKKDNEYVKKGVEECKKNADYIYNFFKENDFKCMKPNGAFYIFPNVKKFFGKSLNGKVINSSMDFSKVLLDEEKVASLPGSDFGVPNNIRLALAIPTEEVQEGCKRIQNFINKLE